MAAGIKVKLIISKSSSVRGSFKISLAIQGANVCTRIVKKAQIKIEVNNPAYKYFRAFFSLDLFFDISIATNREIAVWIPLVEIARQSEKIGKIN